MGKKDIEKYQFKKGNKFGKGRPKQLVSTILASLKEEGELVTRSLVSQTYQVLLSLPQKKLAIIARDAEQPMINRIVAKEMLGKKGFEIVEKMLDRANGKPTNMQEIIQETITTEEDLTKLTTDELKRRIQEAADADNQDTEDTAGDS